jgi:hypothetical protein
MSTSEPSSTPSSSPKVGRIVTGVLLIVCGLTFGLLGTLAMFMGESLMLATPPGRGRSELDFHYGTLLTFVASVLLVASGVALLVAARSSQGLAAAGRGGARLAFWLAALAFAAYIFGFVVCVAEAQ